MNLSFAQIKSPNLTAGGLNSSSLKEVKVFGQFHDILFFGFLVKCCNLESLVLSGGMIQTKTLHYFNTIFRKLRKIRITNDNRYCNSRFVEQMALMAPSLQIFDITLEDRSRFNDRCMFSIMTSLPNLQSLSLTFDSFYQHFEQQNKYLEIDEKTFLPSLKNLKKLSLSGLPSLENYQICISRVAIFHF